MLTLEETRWTLKALEILSISNLLPIKVDVKSGKIQRQSNKVKTLIWKILYSVAISHWLYMFARLVQSTIFEPEKYFRWDHFVLHLGMAGFYGLCYFNGFRLFVKNPEENVMIFNQLLKEREDPVQKIVDRLLKIPLEIRSENPNTESKLRGKSGTQMALASASTSARQQEKQGQNQNQDNENSSRSISNSRSEMLDRARPLLTWPPQYSLDELIGKLLPLMLVPTAVCAILNLAVDPTRPQLLFSVLPPEWQNLWSFLALLAVEVLCYAVVDSTLCFDVVTQILFFSKCQSEFKRMSLQLRNLEERFQNRAFGREIEGEIWILRQISKEMRELVLFIELFNRCFPFPIFAWKLFSLSLCIVFYFFIIRHAEDFPIFGFFVGYIAILVTVVYIVMYGHAFSIPGKMEELKQEFLLTAQKTTSNSISSKILGAEMKREVKRIQSVGIKVGSFNQMERQSTPIFVDFVVNQVVSLLVTFPR